MTAEKTQTPADHGVSVTLYKAVTATVTCAQFRSYLSSIGMRLVNLEGDDETEAWVGVDGRRVYVSGDADDMEHAIARLAKIVSVSPGEMLMRIVGPTPSYPGAVPWRSRADTSPECYALVYRNATDTQAADFLAGHAEDMRERCVKEAESWDDGSASGGRARCVANAIRVLPLTAGAGPCEYCAAISAGRATFATGHTCGRRPAPVVDPSAELRARLVAELHAAGRPQFADLVAQRGDWRALIRFIDTMAMALLSDHLRGDLGIEAPK